MGLFTYDYNKKSDPNYYPDFCVGYLDSIIFIALVFLILWASFGVHLYYTKNGDIGNTYRLEKDGVVYHDKLYDLLAQWYTEPEEIVERLHKLTTYYVNAVKWPYYLLLSIIMGIIFLIIFRIFSWVNIIIAVGFLFLGFIIGDHWYDTHVYGGQQVEAAILHALYRNMMEG